jgi:SAM-dependent methyltransferase
MDIKQRVLGRIMQWWAAHGGLAQFHQPTGAVGHVAGWIMGRRSSNVARNRWAVQLLDVQPADRVIELGCGPGVAIAALATRATRGLVVGVDHSQVMIRQARRRNRAATGRTGTPDSHAGPEPVHQRRAIQRRACRQYSRHVARPDRPATRTRPAVAARRAHRPGIPAPLSRCHRGHVGGGRQRAGRPAYRSWVRAPPNRNARPRPAGGVRPRARGTCR